MAQSCAVCGKPFADQRPDHVAASRRAPAKLYCGQKCSSRAEYLRRKERQASVPVLIADPIEIGPDGWPRD